MRDRYKIGKVDKRNSKAYGMQVVLVDGDKYKDSIAARMRRKNGPGSWMVYKDCDEEYAKQVTAEHKVVVRAANGSKSQRWVQKHSHGDNHYLDCEVYAMAAAEIRGIRNLHQIQNEPEEENTPAQKLEEHRPEEAWIEKQEHWLM